MFPEQGECSPTAEANDPQEKPWNDLLVAAFEGRIGANARAFRAGQGGPRSKGGSFKVHGATSAGVAIRQKHRSQIAQILWRQWRSQITAQIRGESVTFKTLEEKFDALVQYWHELRDPGSSTDDLHNPAYLQIIGMGEPAIPLLLREVNQQTGHWFSALKFITGAIVKPEAPGGIPQLRRAWLQWGRENGYDTHYGEGSVAEEEPSAPRRK